MKPSRLALLLLPAIVFFAFHARTLDYEFVWTDVVEIVGGALILPVSESHRAFTEPMPGTLYGEGMSPYYRPLQIVVLSALHELAGPTPRVYRLTSLVCGALTASAFMALAWGLIGRPLPALFAALLPGLHPAGLEAYVWIAGLSQAMAVLFLVSSLGCAFLFLRRERSSPSVLACCLGLFALALLAKENATILPVLLLALVAGDSLSKRETPGATIRVAGFDASLRGIALVAGLGVASVLYFSVWRPFALQQGSIGGASAIDGSRLHHVLTALSLWPSTLWWMLVPWESTTSDVVPIVRSVANPMVWLGVALPLVSLAAWVALARRGFTAAALGLAWIWIAFLPSANLVPALHAKADRYVFLPAFGLALVLAQLAPHALTRIRAPHLAAPILAVAMLGLVAQRSWARAPDWRSNETLFARDVARDPDYREGRYWLSVAFLQQGRYEEALPQLEFLIEHVSRIPGKASFFEGDAHGHYCHALVGLGRIDAAREFVRNLEATLPKRAASRDVRGCLAAAQADSTQQ